MVFSSTLFLFFFLPIVLGGYYVVRKELRNFLLLLASLFFYAWGEHIFVLVMLTSITVNYGLGVWLAAAHHQRQVSAIVALAVLLNLGLLGWYKYANFFVENMNALLPLLGGSPVTFIPVHLPIGISFLTFHALSYVIDVARREVPAQKNPLHLALYLALFPQLIAGPIVRYVDIAAQLTKRIVTLDGFALGVQRFIIGLGKKVLVANTMAVAADGIFAIPAQHLTAGLAWLGVVCYTLQIYFDFSGYSDMAIGLGHMFGFRFRENFQYPYIAQSIKEFWRRWHISLSTWFRDYLYIPLGGNQCGPLRTYSNLVIVFFLCGLWHGASWTFVAWGLFHGFFLVLERLGLEHLITACAVPLRHLYVMLVVMSGWVLFRADSLHQAMTFFTAMSGLGQGSGVDYHVWLYLDNKLLLVLVAGTIGSTPVLPFLQKVLTHTALNSPPQWSSVIDGVATFGSVIGLSLIFFGATLALAAGTHNPFIYFRF